MSTARIIADSDFNTLASIPELRADPLFNRAISAYAQSQGKGGCCGGAAKASTREHLTLAGAALRRYHANDPAGLARILRKAFNISADQTISVGLGAGFPIE